MNNTNSENKVLSTIISPIQRFLKIEASGGILLIFFTVLALVWANSSFGHYYHELWHTHVDIGIGSFKLSHSILHWVNDGLMAVFFFVVGLEIKRELVVGELSSIKQASLPIAAAIGGMLVPAGLYLILNTNAASEGGWGIPMATDIAFSLGVLSLLGKRVPLALKVFLVAFAIVDDLGAVLVIALFYSGEIYWNFLLIGLGLFLVLLIFNRMNVRFMPFYLTLGIFIWFMFLYSGIHPTLAGVLIAFSIPMKRKIDIPTFRLNMDRNLTVFSPTVSHAPHTLSHEQLDSLDNIQAEMNHVQSPVQSLEHYLHPLVTYVIMPLFALTNAGVVFKAAEVGDLFEGLSGTIEISLILGKVIGIFVFTWVSLKLGVGILPARVKMIHVLGLGFLGGMGFTMSLFISNLAFSGPLLQNPAKIGILMGSLIAGILGYLLLYFTLEKPSAEKQ